MTIRKTASGGQVTGVEPMTVDREVLGPPVEDSFLRREGSKAEPPWTAQDEQDLARESDDGPSAL